MKQFIVVLFSALFIASCFWGDEEQEYKKLSKDFWLNWWGDPEDYHVLLSTDKDGRNGLVIIEETVFALAANNHFILAKQYPNKEKEIANRLFMYDTIEKDYLLKNPSDTIYLAKEDSFYQKNNQWYHNSNGWNPPDSLKPYKRITYYHIIDIRQYKSGGYEGYKIYTFENENDFNLKRKELHIPDTMQLRITYPGLQ